MDGHEIRAVVTDLDGTVVDRGQRISPATLRAATDLAAHGIPLIIATARTPTWVATLEPLVSSVSVAVCCGGTVGWSPGVGRTLWRETIPSDGVEKIVRVAAQRLPHTGIAAYDGEQWRITETFAARGVTRLGAVEILLAEQIAQYPACALSFVAPSGCRDELLRALAADVGPEFAVESPAAGDVIDIAPLGTSKAAGVTRALAEVRVDPAHAIAFGDTYSDLSMFQLCGHSVAVANADPGVIAAATAVASCVHDDGFARMLGDLGVIGAYRPDAAQLRTSCSCRLERASDPSVGRSVRR